MIQADEALIERTKQVAAERGVSFAQVAREALERTVGPPPPRRLPRFVGKYEFDEDAAERSADLIRVPPRPWRSS